jgi:hypothetical protein
MGVLEPVEASASLRIATTDEVITTRRTEGYFKALLRIDVVPWIAGITISFSGSSVCFRPQSVYTIQLV